MYRKHIVAALAATALVSGSAAPAVAFAPSAPAYAAAAMEAPAASPGKKCKKKGGVIGAVVGGIAGGLLGSKVKKGVGTVVGIAAGALIGNAIGNKLDDCEKQKMSDATLEAVNDPSTRPAEKRWTSDTREGVGGTVTAAPPRRTADGRECRRVTQVSYVNGEEVRETPTLCRTPPQNSWAMTA